MMPKGGALSFWSVSGCCRLPSASLLAGSSEVGSADLLYRSAAPYREEGQLKRQMAKVKWQMVFIFEFAIYSHVAGLPRFSPHRSAKSWIPAFAGMTEGALSKVL